MTKREAKGGGRVPGADLALVRALMTNSRIGMFGSMFEEPTPKVRPVPKRVRGFRVRVDLMYAKPPVWRRLVLPGDLMLDEVHEVLQIAMGWTDSHLHKFGVTSEPRRHAYFLSAYDVSEGDEGVAEEDVRLDQVLTVKGDKLFYDYDFGDGWDHVVVVEEILDVPPPTPICLKGKMACPPEDCGGLGGYEELADWVRGGYDPKATPMGMPAGEMRDWLPLDWHPDHFSVDEVNEQLTALARD